MNAQRLGLILTGVNLVLLTGIIGFRFAPPTPALAAQAAARAQVLRGRALEIVDERGTVRSRLDVEPDGEIVLRMTDRRGAIRVKLGAGDAGSGLLLADESTEPGVHLVARREATPSRPTTTSLTLRAGGDQRRVITPR